MSRFLKLTTNAARGTKRVLYVNPNSICTVEPFSGGLFVNVGMKTLWVTKPREVFEVQSVVGYTIFPPVQSQDTGDYSESRDTDDYEEELEFKSSLWFG